MAQTSVPRLAFKPAHLLTILRQLQFNNPRSDPQLVNHQRQLEESLVSDPSFLLLSDCPVDTVSLNLNRVMSTGELSGLKTDQPFDVSQLKTIACVTNALLYNPPTGNLVLNEGEQPNLFVQKLQEYVHQLQQIGDDSVEGVVMKFDLGNNPDIYVAKAPKGKSNLLHELIIGVYGANFLRESGLPNFSYVYGAVTCGPTLSQSGVVQAWCRYPGQIRQILYEYVPGISFRKYTRTCSPQEFCKAYLQICLSLNIAQAINFTHYDLHHQNVMLRPIDEDQPAKQAYIVYATPWGNVYLQTDRVATMIDYGYGHMTLNRAGLPREHVGMHNLQYTNTQPNQAQPLYDAFKLLGFCIGDAIEYGRTDLYPVLTYMLSFFLDLTNYTLVDFDKDFWPSRYSLPINPQLDLTSYLAYLRQKPETWPLIEGLTLEQVSQLEVINRGVADRTSQNLAQLELTASPRVYDLFDLYRLRQEAGPEAALEAIKGWGGPNNFEGQLRSFGQHINTVLAKVQSDWRQLQLIYISTYSDLLFDTSLAKYRSYVLALVSFFNQLTHIKEIGFVAVTLQQLMPQAVSSYMSVSLALLQAYRNFRQQIKSTLVKALNNMADIVEAGKSTAGQELNQAITKNKAFRWYSDSLPVYHQYLRGAYLYVMPK